jgi:Ca2+-binding EF-hand superfamily protein
VYDVNHSGVMEPAELHWFLNDLFKRLGDSRRYTPAELLLIFKEADVNHDGHIDKRELFRICKLIFNKSPYVGTVTYYVPPTNSHIYEYHGHRPVHTKVVFQN